MKKRIISMALTLILLLGLAVPAFADSSTAPTSSSNLNTITGITSVTVEGTSAYFQTDNNIGSGEIYIRAKLPNTSTWEDLQSAEVIFTLESGYTVALYDANVLVDPDNQNVPNTYTLNLLNKRYYVVVTDGNATHTYYLAAGFLGRVAIDDNDDHGIASATLGSASTLSIYGSVVQNNYMGNTYYVNNGINWTDTNVSYYISGVYTPNNMTTASVSKTITFCQGASNASVASGGCLNNDGSLNLSGSMSYINVINNNVTRRYYISAVVDGTATFHVTASTYTIDFTELLGDEIYGEDYLDNIETIENKLSLFYIYNQNRYYSSSQSVMDVMLDFIAFANFSNYTYCSDTYLSTLNGLGEFSAGSASGWMYMDDVYDDECIVPNVGAADYSLGDASVFTWFFTTDFTNHYSGW